jgi:hypothetical protein
MILSPPVSSQPTLLYCRCAYAQVVPQGVKDDVLRRLCDSETTFESVADLCEMAAHRDPRLESIARTAANGGLCIAACHARAVRGLFRQAGCPLPPENVRILNMREQSAANVAEAMLGNGAAVE